MQDLHNAMIVEDLHKLLTMQGGAGQQHTNGLLTDYEFLQAIHNCVAARIHPQTNYIDCNTGLRY